jgi:hypothetical protein
VIGNTDAIGQNSQSLADWATEMQGTGADATALNTIISANASIQESLIDIQAAQAPILAELAQSQADYIAELEKQPAAQQLAALAMMDATTVTQAQELAMLAASAAAGELGVEGSKMAESLIIGAAEANPGLMAILENMGLISETDGEITVNFPNATSLADTLTGLQTAINDLVNATYMLIVTADPDDAFTDIESVRVAVEGLPDGTVDLFLDTGGFWEAWNALPSYKQINVHTVSGDYGYEPFALGGNVPYDTAALGRMARGNMTLVGENGPELALLPGGTTVIPNHATRYRDDWKGGGGITFNGPITVVANDPQAFMRQMRTYSTTMERR